MSTESKTKWIRTIYAYFSHNLEIVYIYKRYQTILFLNSHHIWNALGDWDLLLEGNFKHKNDIQCTPTPKVHIPYTQIYIRKNFCVFFLDFQTYKEEGNFQIVGVNFSLPICIPDKFYKVSAAIMPRIVQVIWIFFVKIPNVYLNFNFRMLLNLKKKWSLF